MSRLGTVVSPLRLHQNKPAPCRSTAASVAAAILAELIYHLRDHECFVDSDESIILQLSRSSKSTDEKKKEEFTQINSDKMSRPVSKHGAGEG